MEQEWSASKPCGARLTFPMAGSTGRSRAVPGKFLGIPHDWRRPTLARIKSRWWNPDDPRLFTPKAFGWGYDINLARLFGRRHS